MSIIKSIKQVLGLGPAAENHFWDGSVANQLTLKRGTPDAPGDDALIIDSVNKVVKCGTTYNTDPLSTVVGAFLRRGAFGLGTQNTPAISGDMGAAVGSGFYWFDPSVTSRPPGVDYGVLLHLGYNVTGGGNWAQIVIPTSPAGNLYYRTLTNGVFSAWMKLTGVAA